MMKGMKTKKLDRGHLSRRFEQYNIEKWIEKDPEEKFVVGDCGAKGKGLFVRQDVNKGDFLLFYRGNRLDKESYRKISQDEDNSYVFVNEKHNLYIDAKDPNSGLARFINDCSNEKPNCDPKLYIDTKGQKQIKIAAIKGHCTWTGVVVRLPRNLHALEDSKQRQRLGILHTDYSSICGYNRQSISG